MILGLDISHHQTAAVVPWADLQQRGSFLYVRATYGTTRDRRVREHFARAKELGIPVGLYHFYRPSQSVLDQLDAFGSLVSLIDYGPGDLAPALDIELDPVPREQPVTREWSAPTKQIADTFCEVWSECLIYITQREWSELGKPGWVLERPLWTAHYTKKPAPATPGGKPWHIWQYAVRPYNPNADDRTHLPKDPKALDHNVAVEPLPVIRGFEEEPSILSPRPALPTPEPEFAPTEPPRLIPLERDLAGERAERDKELADRE